MTTISRTLQAVDRMHARPAYRFVRTVLNFDAQVRVTREGGGRVADGTSLTDLVSLGVAAPDRIVIEASGREAAEVIEALSELVAIGFRARPGEVVPYRSVPSDGRQKVTA